MRNLGIQNIDREIIIEPNIKKDNKDIIAIKELFVKLQEGYTERNLDSIDKFVRETFINSDDICILGTGTEEIFLGIERVKELFENDWKYWGDVKLDLNNLYIDIKNEIAWFHIIGVVKQSFEDTERRYDSYIDFTKNIIEDNALSSKQKLTFINWVLSLAYHQREGKNREEYCPLDLTGILIKDNNKWKFHSLHFSIPRANFPDERFENSNEFIDSYNRQNKIRNDHKFNYIDLETKYFLFNFQKEFFGANSISYNTLDNYFNLEDVNYVVEDNNIFLGKESIYNFFNTNNDFLLEFDLENSILSEKNNMKWLTTWGLLKGEYEEERLMDTILEDIDELFKRDISSKDKLFSMHRSISYLLKESSFGKKYTYPIRMTATLEKKDNILLFNNLHFSYPHYWIFEGKLDSLK